MEKEAAKEFLRQVLEPKTDQAFVITFDISVDLAADYTASSSRLDHAIDKAEINTGTGGGSFIPGISKNVGTALFDAVYFAGTDEFKQEAGRHAMVIITDGQDEGSKEKIQNAIEAAQRADALIFVLLMYDPHFYGGGISLGYSGDHDMKKLSDATGGHVYVIGHDGRKLEKAFDDLATALHTEYVATFTPAKSRRQIPRPRSLLQRRRPEGRSPQRLLRRQAAGLSATIIWHNLARRPWTP